MEEEHTVFLKTIIPSRRPQSGTSIKSPTMKMDADEKELLDSVERGERKSAKGGKRERARYSRYAKATFRKDRRLNIRLSSKDLEAIQKRRSRKDYRRQAGSRRSGQSRRGVLPESRTV